MANLSDQRIQLYLPQIRSYLVEAARSGRMVGYQELADVVGTNRRSVGDVLNVLDLQEHAQQRPLISAIVVRKGRGTPGPGFHEIQALLHHTTGRDLEAWRAERDRVCAFDWPD